MGILKKVTFYIASAYASGVAIRYAWLYASHKSRDYVWNNVTGDSRDTTPSLSEALFLTQAQAPEYKAYLQFLVRFGKTYASEEDHN